ncbi:hypothetical protein BSKO_03796 [Bryopsis sp. KO-2023]|nr:hypothetical protein BSKO_03796 [Bryopsis sp. KO-2023]
MERWLDAETEEDFFRLQDELTSGRIRPAAKATRVKRKGVPSSPPQPPPDDESARVRESTAGGPGIVGDILERNTGGCVASAPEPPSTPSSGFPEPQSYKVSKFALKRQKNREKAKKKTVRFNQEAERQEPREAGTEENSIDFENKAKLLGMSATEVKEAQEEVASRLSDKTLEFLKKRGTKKSTRKASPKTVGVSERLKRKAPEAATSMSDGKNPEGEMAGSKLVGFPATHARLRFDMDGKVVGVISKEEWEKNMDLEQMALERDCLREEERGENSDGYTMEEWCVLSRSRVVGQRALAMQGLCSILSIARPSFMDVDENLQLKEREVQIPQSLGISEKVKWSSLWQLGVEDLDVGSIAMRGLDDKAVSVIMAAIGLINAMCCMTSKMERIYEDCDANPSVGWPVIPLAQVVRSSELGVWEEDVPDEGKEWPIHSRGNLLPRLVHLGLLDIVGSMLRAPPVANLPALVSPLLLSCARSGEELAMGVLRSKPICDMFKEHLSSMSVAEGSSGAVEAKRNVLKLVRVLAQSSKQALLTIQKQGLLALVRQHLFSLWMMESSCGEGTPHNSMLIVDMKVECLRMWRVCCLNGTFLARFDDMYAVLCRDLSAPCSGGESGDCLGEGGGGHLGEWMVSREVFITLAAAVTQSMAAKAGEPETISIGACTALVQEADKWLEETVVDEVRREWTSSRMEAANLAKEGGGSHSPKGKLAALSAVLTFLATYWNAQRQNLASLRSKVIRLDLVVKLLLQEEPGCGNVVDWVCRKTSSGPDSDGMSAAIGSMIVSILRCAEALEMIEEMSEIVMQLLDKMQSNAFNRLQATSWPLKLDPLMLCRLQSKLPMQNVALAVLHSSKILVNCHEGVRFDRKMSVKAVELGLHVITTLPPGFEAQGLKCLAAITDAGILAPLLTGGLQMLEDLLQSDRPLSKDVGMYQKQGGCPKLDLSELGKCILTTYAVSWLSLVPEEALEGKPKLGKSVAEKEADGSVLGAPFVKGISGSRMLFPHDWPTLEAFYVPEPGASLTSSNHPVVATILLTLSLEAAQSRFLSVIPPGKKLRNLLGLVYLTRADELCPGLTGTIEVWQDDWVRRSLAGLSEHYCPQLRGDGHPLSSWCGEFFVRKLVDVFASSSFGDPLFGRHVALLLQSGGKNDVVKWVWEELMEKQCLELLPPMDVWFGGKEAYCFEGKMSKHVLDFVRSTVEDGALEGHSKSSGAVEFADILLSGK